MAETKPTVTAASRSISSVQPKRSRNSVSWLAPLVCIILGYIIWRFVIGSASNFDRPDPAGGFWPNHEGPRTALSRMYLGGIIVPILIGALLTVITFVIERLTTVSRASGTQNLFVQYNITSPIKILTKLWQLATNKRVLWVM